MDWKTQYCQNGNPYQLKSESLQIVLQIQNNPYQNPSTVCNYIFEYHYLNEVHLS